MSFEYDCPASFIEYLIAKQIINIYINSYILCFKINKINGINTMLSFYIKKNLNNHSIDHHKKLSN